MKLLYIKLLLLWGLTKACSLAAGEYNWNKISFPSVISDSDTIYSINALNKNEAIAVGSNGVLICVNYDAKIYLARHYGAATFHWVSFADSLHGWVVGDYGTIYATGDGGDTWTQQISGVDVDLNALVAVDKNNVWIAGDSGVILGSIDGGKSWNYSKITSVNNTVDKDDFDFLSVAFNNNHDGCVGGNRRGSNVPIVLITCDGGVSWQPLDVGPQINGLGEVAYKDDSLNIFLSYRAGGSFIKLPQNNSFKCKANLKMCEMEPSYKNNYFLIHLFEIAGSYYNCKEYYYTPHKIVKYEKPLYCSGLITNFARISNQTINTIDVVDSQTAWIAGTNGSIYRTVDQGKAWIEQSVGKNQYIDNLSSIYFYDVAHGYIGGKNGTFISTNDTGKSWRAMLPALNVSISFRDVLFTDAQHGVVVINHETLTNRFSVLGTTNGGNTWTSDDKCSMQYGVGYLHFSKIDNMIILRSGMGFKTSENGGVDWSPLKTVSFPTNVTDLYLNTVNTFFVVGSRGEYSDGAIFRSYDHGASFDFVSSVDRSDSRNKIFNSITFSNPATGWVAGDSGIILRSIDSGFTWQRQQSLTNERLTKIRFCNKNFGWISGGNKIFLTFDGGITWQDRSILTSTKVNDVFCSDPENCWAVGDDGLILHLSNKAEKCIKVAFPSGSQKFSKGDSLTVRWESVGVDSVSIAVSYDNGNNYSIYRAVTENDGQEVIRISANAVPSTTCKVRVRNIDGAIQGESELFTISGSSPTIGAEKLMIFSNECRITEKSIIISSKKGANANIALYSVSGRIVYRHSVSVNECGRFTEKIPTEKMDQGYYIACVKIEGKYFTGKVLIQK
jgi:photosystem II stability/assembly factor-like uncharacterized protein